MGLFHKSMAKRYDSLDIIGIPSNVSCAIIKK